ncbi:protein kinase [Acidobacteria bacterium AH-259-G07]|nr:protein kinase [Acidobacteria bacterium AH-259-G07]
MVGKTISHYKILEKLGEGGMGEVFLAHDTSLDRKVALKFLPEFLQEDPTAKKRFLREAKSAAALDHPFICHIHEVGEAEGNDFISMEYVQGETLKEKLADGPLPLKDVLQKATEIAEALEAAHKQNIVHRDLKPANIMLTPQGHVKVMDFGLAKRLTPVEGLDSQEKTLTASLTKTGVTLGTLAYMSPEQLRGEDVDTRSDIFSFGIVLYEMLSGVDPFKKSQPVDTASSILKEDPHPLARYMDEVTPLLQDTVMKMLAKEPRQRYQSISELSKNLDECRAKLSAPTDQLLNALLQTVRRPRIAFLIVLILVVGLLFGYWFFNRAAQKRWAREEAIPEIKRLIGEDDYVAAFSLYQQAERYIPTDPTLVELWPLTSQHLSITTSPDNVDLFFKGYSAASTEWEYLGRSPIDTRKLPAGPFRLRVEKQGFEAFEGLFFDRSSLPGRVQRLSLELHEEGTIPPRMVRIPASDLEVTLTGFDGFESIPTPAYLIDKYEVTNRQFKGFVDSGGYENREYWKHEFVHEGRVLSWEQAMSKFRDRTGRPGPSTWEGGTYPKGKDEYPVSGVSWYEAAAFSEFAGKSLPTVYHWAGATAPKLAAYIVPFSNFGGEGPAPVGSHPAGPHGTYDMAGNVKEWCWNATGSARYILGGGWNDPIYLFYEPDTRLPFDRSPANGFRCVQYLGDEEIPQGLLLALDRATRDYSKEEPVSDEIFQVYKSQYSYDPTPLEAIVESVEDSSQYWRQEKVTFNAAYGNERLIAYLFIPRNVDSPYQTVIYFPGSSAILQRSSEALRMRIIDFIVKSGRAVMYPIYKGTYERNHGIKDSFPNPTRSYADFVLQLVNDVRRSVDYLMAREDIDADNIVYYGFSWGGRLGSIVLALEDRFKVGVLLDGGFPYLRARPEVSEINFAPHVDVPVLMLNGAHDAIFPVERNQEPMFKLLGTPEEHKEHILYETGHVVFTTRKNQAMAKILTWLDRYVGPVQ